MSDIDTRNIDALGKAWREAGAMFLQRMTRPVESSDRPEEKSERLEKEGAK